MKLAHTAALLALLAAAITTTTARAQDLVTRAPKQTKPIAIINADIHTVSGPTYEKGFILFADGVIRGLGSGPLPTLASPPDIIDAKGAHVYPGMISPVTRLGLTEIGAVRASHDFNETGAISPEVWAAVAVNPDSWLLTVARKNGVLAAGVFPSGGLVPGRPSVLRLEGWTWEDLAVKRDAGLLVSWPFMRTVTNPFVERPEDDQRTEIRRNVQRLKDTFRTARAYLAEKDGPRGKDLDTDLRWEAMRGVLGQGRSAQGRDPSKGDDKDQRLPVFIEAADYDQITAAVNFAVENNLRAVIVGGRDAVLAAPLLKQHDIPVLFASVITMPKRDDSGYDDVYTTPARLHAAGVRFALASGEEPPHERNLPYAAAMAIAHGLPRDIALRSVTLSPAEILGVGDTLGSLDVGKEATLFIADGDPLEVTTNISRAFVQGKDIPLTSKQSDLAQKYREKYKQSGQTRREPGQ